MIPYRKEEFTKNFDIRLEEPIEDSANHENIKLKICFKITDPKINNYK